jgi:hypothetical protein
MSRSRSRSLGTRHQFFEPGGRCTVSVEPVILVRAPEPWASTTSHETYTLAPALSLQWLVVSGETVYLCDYWHSNIQMKSINRGIRIASCWSLHPEVHDVARFVYTTIWRRQGGTCSVLESSVGPFLSWKCSPCALTLNLMFVEYATLSELLGQNK